MRSILTGLILGLLAPTLRADNWPAWRGPSGNGIAPSSEAPLEWGRDKNVRWKIELPAPGNSTPIVWEDRIFLTQAEDEGKKRSLICLDRQSGKELWKQTVPFDGKEPLHRTNTYCAASPVTDGERVVVSHGSAGMHCYDFEGKKLWDIKLAPMIHIWGNASSPIIHENLAILWCGPGEQQYLLAVDKRTGKEVWRHDEPGGNDGTRGGGKKWVGSWSTPIVAKVKDRDELILTVPNKVKGFDPKTGKELWHCDGLTNLIYTSPVISEEGIVVAFSGFHGTALAVRAGGEGDVTKTHRLWHHPERYPQRIGSAVIDGDKVFLMNDPGTLQCFDLKTGKEIASKARLGQRIWGSLVKVGDRLYVADARGDTAVISADKEMKLLADNPLREMVRASLVVEGGDILIRTYEHLWCIGAKK